MIATLLAWLFITVLCWSYGNIFLSALQKLDVLEQKPSYHFSTICFTGFSLLTIVAGYISLITALGQFFVLLLIAIPALVYFIGHYKFMVTYVGQKINVKQYSLPLILLLANLLFLILVMSVWTMNHPDTLGYHAQTIQWIEKYKAVPGLVHLNIRLGYQGLWYVISALFSFSFLPLKALTFANTTVLVWFFLFLFSSINYCIKKNQPDYKTILQYIFLLILSTWSFTQVRLTAISASADFIATLYAWLIFYLLIYSNSSKQHYLLLTFLCFVGITIKLSIIPILLVAVVATIKQLKLQHYKVVFLGGLIAILTVTPFLLRNIITTGYLVFPFPKAKVANVNWAYNLQQTVNEKNYIQAYAIQAKEYTSPAQVKQVINMSILEWVPGWWQAKSLADKVALSTLLLLLICTIFGIKQIYHNKEKTTFIALLIALTGVCFWFINAPDPRFGYSFIIPFMGIAISSFKPKLFTTFNKPFINIILYTFCTVLLAYNAYRLLHFFSVQNVLVPSGINTPPVQTFKCKNLKFYTTPKTYFLANLPVPATYDDSCTYFTPRGTKITDGFKAKH